MRIRKRKVPLPLSLLSPVPLSDPNLFSRSPVMVTLQGADYTSASDLRRLIVANTTDDTTRFEGGDDGIQASNDVLSNASITTTTTTTRGAAIAVADLAVAADDDNNNGLLSLSNNKGRWCDGDKAIPLKKRRGISFNNDFVEIEQHSSTIIVDDKKLNAATLTKRNLKEDEQSTIHDDNNNNNNNNSNANMVVLTSAKKSNSKRGNTIMEGSRCSRVNGRGWRCCQPTLVGYSLCEHHLGKGRLRSMTSSSSSSTSSSLKSRAASKKKINSLIQNNTSNFALGRVEKDNSCDNEKSKLERMSSFGNKRVKLGVVKARSLSSLLGQTNTMSKIVGDESMQQHQDHY